jgi:hypothetical protein
MNTVEKHLLRLSAMAAQIFSASVRLSNGPATKR